MKIIPRQECDQCGECPVTVAQVGGPPDYDSATACICIKSAESELRALIQHARIVQMTDKDRREQAASFAFGQVALMKEHANDTQAELAELMATCRRLAGCQGT